MGDKFESSGEFRWRLQDTNNKIIADSAEGYTRKESVERAIPNVKDAGAKRGDQRPDVSPRPHGTQTISTAGKPETEPSSPGPAAMPTSRLE